MKRKPICLITRILLFAVFFTFINCSSDDDSGPEDPVATCSIVGSIDASIVGNWTGGINFVPNNTEFELEHEFKSDGTFVSDGEGLQNVTGCWRVSGTNNIRFAGQYTNGTQTEFVNANMNIINQDSIYGTHSSTFQGADVTGEIWFVR